MPRSRASLPLMTMFHGALGMEHKRERQVSNTQGIVVVVVVVVVVVLVVELGRHHPQYRCQCYCHRRRQLKLVKNN